MLLLLLACSGGPPAPPPAGPLGPAGLTASSGAVAWRALDALDGAELTFPPTNTPAGETFDGTFRLGGPWTDAERRVGRLRDFATPLPFPCDMPRPNYAPLGARLYRGGTEVPFAGGAEPAAGQAWYVEKGELHVLSMEDPNTWREPGELRVPEIAASLARRNFAAANVAPAAFAAVEATVGPITRPALYVPAPGRASFPVTPPAGARLEVGAALLPDPLRGSEAGDGATAIVEVDGEAVWTQRLTPGGGFEDTTVDLAKWAGRPVHLTFRTEPGATGDYDYVVFSTPTVLQAPRGEPRHVLVVGIDTLRQDALGFYGRDRDTSPELDAWAQGAVVFDQARAPAPRTRPSFRTALTGRYPIEAQRSPTVAEVLRGQGFRTAGFAANVHLVPRFGFNAGFEHWHYENGARAEDEVERAMAWMDAHQDEDTFTFVHVMDPHTWYNAPLPYGVQFTHGRTSPRVPALFDRWQIVQLTRRKALTDEDQQLIRDQYDGEVAYTSHALAPLLAAADTWRGRTVTVLHSDHGEEFWDHGGFEHNHSVYDELVHVVLAIRPPGGWGGGPHRIAAPVGLQDLVPTMLDLLDVPTGSRPPTDGVSLRPFVDAAVEAQAPALTTTLQDRPLYQGHLMFDRERWSVVYQGWKYILHTSRGTEELYDLGADPHEKADRVADAPADRLATMRAALERASGWPVRPGWRLEIRSRVRAPFEVHFSAPIAGAGILDPESDRQVRANLEWGEHPPLTVADVGTVTLSADRTGFTFTPGQHPEEQRLYVTCDGSCPPAQVVSADGASMPLNPGTLEIGPTRVKADPGTIIVPAAVEGDAMAAPTDTTQLEALKVLGYIDGD